MRKFKVLGIALTLVLIAALMAVASGATSAYFSDTKSGTITGDIGSILVTTSGGVGSDSLDFTWTKMLPGEVYSDTVTYQNTGENVQDVWLVFPNATALSAINSLGRYGAVRVTSTNGAYFYSNNLNDHPHDTLVDLPNKILLAEDVGPTASGSMTFSFQYASRMSTPEPGGVFNMYPVLFTGGPTTDLAPIPGTSPVQYYGQVTVEAGVTGSGLPYRIVATQPNIEPGAVGDYAGF